MRIVLAEDDPIIRMDIRRLLEDTGCQVVAECGDGANAIKLTQKQRPQVVLMDIKMPGTDGITATRSITRQKLAPVVLLTSYSDQNTIQEAMNSGALGYLLKPVDKNKLHPTLQIANQRFLEMCKLSIEVNGLEGTLADRTDVLKAKIMLQKKLCCSEEAAYDIIRRMSMSQQCTIGIVARQILKKEL